MTSFALRPSRLQQNMLVALHAGVALLLVYSNLPLFHTVGALLLCVVAFILAERARRKQGQFKYLLVDAAGFYLATLEGKRLNAEPCGELLSTPFLIILPLLLEKPGTVSRSQKVSLVLFCDALAKDDWRKLRVLLRTMPSAVPKQ